MFVTLYSPINILVITFFLLKITVYNRNLIFIFHSYIRTYSSITVNSNLNTFYFTQINNINKITYDFPCCKIITCFNKIPKLA